MPFIPIFKDPNFWYIFNKFFTNPSLFFCVALCDDLCFSYFLIEILAMSKKLSHLYLMKCISDFILCLDYFKSNIYQNGITVKRNISTFLRAQVYVYNLLFLSLKVIFVYLLSDFNFKLDPFLNYNGSLKKTGSSLRYLAPNFPFGTCTVYPCNKTFF